MSPPYPKHLKRIDRKDHIFYYEGMRCFIYARISGLTQQEQSLENQEAICRKQIGNTADEIIVFKDIGSGKDTSQRPNFLRMIGQLQKGDRIYVYDQSRMGRNAEEALYFYRQIIERGAELYCDGKPYGSNTDKFLYTIQAGANEFFRDLQLQKSIEGQKLTKESGNWVTRGDMLGWRVYKTRGQTKAEIDPIAQKYLTHIFEQYSTGRSLRSITEDFKNVIIPGYENYRFTTDTMERIINQPLYMGYTMTKKVRNLNIYTKQQLEELLIKSNIYPPIIKEELFWKAFESHRSVRRKHATQFEYRYAAYELSTIFKCPYCSAKWTHHFDKSKTINEKYRSLVHTCGKGTYRDFNKDALEMIVRVALILTFLDHEEVACFFESERNRIGLEKEDIQKELETLEQLITQNRKKQEKLLDLAMEDGIDREIFKERMGKLKEEGENLTRGKNSLTTQIQQKESLMDDYYEEATRDVLVEYGQLEPSLRRDLLKRYLKCAYVREAGFEIEFLNGKRFTTSMWEKRKKRIEPLTMNVSFKGESQYSLILNFQPEQKVKVIDQDYGDDQTNLFFHRRNTEVENKTLFWLGKFLITR